MLFLTTQLRRAIGWFFSANEGGDKQHGRKLQSGWNYEIVNRLQLSPYLSGVLQQLYNWADAFIVGNVDGEISC